VTFAGTMDQIAPVIDTNQHTALVTGSVENPTGELKIGQFATVTVLVPPANGEVTVPAEAVVEDGRESVVFVQDTADPTIFTRQAVRVVRRTQSTISLRDDTAVRPGTKVVSSGALMLNDAMDGLSVSTN
jgi:cobalt-zinc-cadmium efflux system membrane fusion protein